MRESRSRNYLYILLSLLVAMILTIIPLPGDLNWARPFWVLMVLIYWMISLPYTIGMATAWWVGLLVDILMGTLLGMHAFLFVIAVYVVMKWSISRSAPVWQQVILMLVVLALYLTLQFWIFAITGVLSAFSLRYLWPAGTTLLLWPLVFFLLRRYQLRFRLLN